MKLYTAVRTLRAVTLAQSPGLHPFVACGCSELLSLSPLLARPSRTLGGVLAVLYSGEWLGHTLHVLEQDMFPFLAFEAVGLVAFLIVSWHASFWA